MILSRTSSPDGQENLDGLIIIERDNLLILGILDSLISSDPDFLPEFVSHIDHVSSSMNINDLKLDVEKIVQESLNSCTRSGKASIAIALIHKNKAIIGHSGDCRAYIPNHNFITLDHSAAQKRHGTVRAPHRTFANHPFKDWSYPMRTDNTHTFEISKTFNLKKADSIVLCSDGWWRNNSHESIIELNVDSFEKSIQKASEFNVCRDDYSVILYIQD
ncbi:hypothetical protein [Marinomonas sp. ef1]|uniref:hypothetical protein n=1 Tax=Marinomonas sp. ef1 TaxID=2005043 RepID=UPI000C28E17B|nr:hypothetical protein [Marinomonas sp. ef1]